MKRTLWLILLSIAFVLALKSCGILDQGAWDPLPPKNDAPGQEEQLREDPPEETDSLISFSQIFDFGYSHFPESI